MILFLGDKELYDFISGLYPDISYEISAEEADKIIIADHSHNSVSVVRYAEDNKIPLLGILDGYKTVAEAFGADCIPCESCSEGKQELAVLDTESPIFFNLGHVTSICRGDPSALDEETLPPELDGIARAETNEIISFCKKNKDGTSNIYAVNFYINSPLTLCAQQVLDNFMNI